jgi:hypothetical protein
MRLSMEMTVYDKPCYMEVDTVRLMGRRRQRAVPAVPTAFVVMSYARVAMYSAPGMQIGAAVAEIEFGRVSL